MNEEFSRRSLLAASFKLGALSLLGPLEFLGVSSKAFGQGPSLDFRQRLSWRANRDVTAEGIFPAGRIEGTIPSGLRGTLFRNGPGQKVNNGVPLQHLFDGDAYLTAFRFEKNQVTTQSQFLETYHRIHESEESRMIYHDFGTKAPNFYPIDLGHYYKISPNISVLPWDGQLLTFSEGGTPFALNPDNLRSEGDWDFHGTLSTILTGFTAHPKLDPATGDGFAYAMSIRRHVTLHVYRMDKASGGLVELYAFPMGGFFMTHDMMITKSYIVFTIVPLEISVAGLVEGRDSIANLLSFDANQPTRIVAFRKDGVGDPIEIVHEKSTFVFHHCNAYEDEQTGHLVFHSCLYEDDEVLSVLGNWGQSATPAPPKGSLTRFEVDLASKKAVSRSEVFQGGIREFPCIDPALVGSENRYLHMLEAGRDFLVFDSVVCLDMKTGRETRMPAEQGHALGEPVFVANPARARGAESDGWILHLGYDGGSDQTYLDIRTPVTLERLARVHTERYFPLGFHGFFKQS